MAIKHPLSNVYGVALGENGYVLCRTCGKEEYGISREVTAEYAFCLVHRQTSSKPTAPVKGKTMSDKKVQSGSKPIKFFIELATTMQDVADIRAAAEKEDYSKSTISIQIGRLRAAGFLPPAEKTENVRREKPTKSIARAVPKPGKKKKAV